ncbi:MFS transporter [Alteromonas confluentis]|uniref:MFS transporter n=1 Tax=Alteromonas confluentis TaxID=1656094 RepID=A0A1E7Z620_9ALTE|nr:MFS transporter [Alteromonas confluentis]OFC68834.1 MFS transporter [Alteromonas confluentis]
MVAHSRTNLILLAITYWLYFGQLGVLTPYLGIFLDGRGFSSADIGELWAVITLSRIVGPSLWASVADKTGKAVNVVRLGCLLSVLCFSTVFWVHSFWGLTLVFGLMMMFWTAVLPQLEVITIQSVKPTKISYGQIRLWGSIGFIVLTVSVGKALDIFTSEAPVYASLFVLTGLFIASLFIRQPEKVPSKEEETGTLWQIAKNRTFLLFLAAAALLQVSFGAYYGFFALYMRDLEYSGQQTGLLIAIGVVAEIGIFLVARRLISRFGVWQLLLACLVLTAMRWYALAAWAQFGMVVVVSQLIHALSFGLAHVTAMHFITHFFPARFQSRGQALYVSIAFGIGGALGNYVAGQLWDQGVHAYETFAFAAGAAFIGALCLIFCDRATINTTRPA